VHGARGHVGCDWNLVISQSRDASRHWNDIRGDWPSCLGGLSMKITSDAVRNSFRFTGDRRVGPNFFRESIFRSIYFRRDTASMLVSLAVGTITLSLYWRALPTPARILFVAALVCLPSAWLRTVSDHARLRKKLARASTVDVPAELLVRASGVSFVGPSLLYAVNLIFFVALGFTMHWLQHLLSVACR
jgi:hypothetical protein